MHIARKSKSKELIMSGNNSSTYVVDKHFQYSHWHLKKRESEWRHSRHLDLTLTEIGANACSTILTGWRTYRYMKTTIRLSLKVSYSILFYSRASHVAPVQDELSQTQTFGATQTPRKLIIPNFYLCELYGCEWLFFDTENDFDSSHRWIRCKEEKIACVFVLPVFLQIGSHRGMLHTTPDHELVQLHWSGAIHMPPL